MKIGLIPINVGLSRPEEIIAIAQHAERQGVESLFTFEHVIVPVSYDSRYPYHPSGKMGAEAETPFVDPLIALSFIAAKTEKIRLGTGVNILAQSNPVRLAKQIASLDLMCGGRFIFGAGVGWLREEFRAMGVPFERRGARFDDAIVAMKKMWAEEVVEHKSDFLDLTGFKSYPLPAQRPHPPVLIGGTSDAAFRRVARHGDGWIAPNRGLDALREMLLRLHRVAADIGRDPSTISVTAMWPYVKEKGAVEEYRKLGVERLIVPLTALGGDPMVGIEELMSSIKEEAGG